MVIKDKIFTILVKVPQQELVSLIHTESNSRLMTKKSSSSTHPDPRAVAALLCDSEHSDIRQNRSHIKNS